MKRRLFHRWTIWLLPLLLIRAFVPAGFMLSAQAGELSIVFCSGTLDRAEEERSDHSAHRADHHSAHHHAGGTEEISDESAPRSDGSNSCPFALAGAVPGQEVAFFAGELSTHLHANHFESLFFASAGPHRSNPIRGPPCLS